MGLLLVFAFISGLITIFAPCIWPLLPLILSTTATGGHRKPLGVVLGIVGSFAVFTLTISYIVKIIPFDPNSLRLISVIVIGFLGLTLLIPRLSRVIEGAVSRLSGGFATRFTGQNTNGFLGGLITGLALGIVWTPCAGPILATIATLAVTNSVNASIILVTAVYSIGVAIPLFLFAIFGRAIFTKSRALSKYTGRVQQVFGAIMILTAILIFTNYDKTLQARLLDYFPSYGNLLIKFESNSAVKEQLDKINNRDTKPLVESGDLFNVTQDLPAPEFTGITNWLNSEPLTMQGLRGKVVLVDFWTYTCINCIRTLPYVTSWDEKYRDKGLVIVGVHSPEFEFEKNTKNVENAIKQYGIKYAVAQDNDFATWNAYSNQYWPAKYLIDKDGKIRYFHFGEGNYDETEKVIQELLKESGRQITEEINNQAQDVSYRGLSPETYLGSQRMQYHYPNIKLPNGIQTLTPVKNIPVNRFILGGEWMISDEYSESINNSVLEYNFNSEKVFLVMRSKDGSVKNVKVFVDGKPVSTNKGADVEKGVITIDSDRLYELVDLENIENHLLRLEFENGVEIFAFTF